STWISAPVSRYVLWRSRTSSRLLIANDLDGVQFRRLARGIYAREQADQERRRRNEQESARVHPHRNRGHKENRRQVDELVVLDQHADYIADHKAQRRAGAADDAALDEKYVAHAAPLGAHGLQNCDIAPFFHHHHDESRDDIERADEDHQ